MLASQALKRRQVIKSRRLLAARHLQQRSYDLRLFAAAQTLAYFHCFRPTQRQLSSLKCGGTNAHVSRPLTLGCLGLGPELLKEVAVSSHTREGPLFSARKDKKKSENQMTVPMHWWKDCCSTKRMVPFADDTSPEK